MKCQEGEEALGKLLYIISVYASMDTTKACHVKCVPLTEKFTGVPTLPLSGACKLEMGLDFSFERHGCAAPS